MLNPVRRALLTLAICSFGLGTGEYVALGLLPDVARDLDVSVSAAGNLVSVYALGVVVGAPLLTAASVRFPRKGLLICLVVALAVGNLLSAVMPTFPSLLAVRFLSGLPHGAFFGLASVQAANLVPENRRSQAMAIVFAGLTVANVVGVPMTTYVGQNTGWRPVFVLIAVVELIGVLGVLAAVPKTGRPAPDSPDAPNLRRELESFRSVQLWLALGVAMIGCGAIFSTFSYISPMMTEVAGYAESSITPLLVLFGLGMTAGNLVGARLSDRYDVSTVVSGVMAAQVGVAVAFYFASADRIASAVMIFLFPFVNTMAFPALQNRIIGMAGGAPNLAAASMHAAFNIANSLGAWLGGLTIAAGWGYNSPNLVAVALGMLACFIAVWAAWIEHSTVRSFRPGTDVTEVPPPSNGPPPMKIPVLGLNTNPIPVIGRYSNTNPTPVIRRAPSTSTSRVSSYLAATSRLRRDELAGLALGPVTNPTPLIPPTPDPSPRYRPGLAPDPRPGGTGQNSYDHRLLDAHQASQPPVASPGGRREGRAARGPATPAPPPARSHVPPSPAPPAHPATHPAEPPRRDPATNVHHRNSPTRPPAPPRPNPATSVPPYPNPTTPTPAPPRPNPAPSVPPYPHPSTPAPVPTRPNPATSVPPDPSPTGPAPVRPNPAGRTPQRPARPGPARPGPAHPGPARPGPARENTGPGPITNARPDDTNPIAITGPKRRSSTVYVPEEYDAG